jgi:hypothetical protein
MENRKQEYKYCRFLDESDRRKKHAIERAERVMKVRSITYDEALDYGEGIDIKHATTEGQKAGVELRYMEIRRQLKIK